MVLLFEPSFEKCALIELILRNHSIITERRRDERHSLILTVLQGGDSVE